MTGVKQYLPAVIFTISMCAFKQNVQPRYFEHHGSTIAEIHTNSSVSIGNNMVSYKNANKEVISLSNIDSIFSKNIVSTIPDSLRNDTFRMRHFAIPVGVKKFSVHPIIPLIPGKWVSQTASNNTDGSINKNYFYNGNKRRLGVFKLRDYPYYFILLY